MLLIKEIEVPPKYAGIVYADSEFGGASEPIRDGSCSTFKGNISSYRLLFEKNEIAYCKFYKSIYCTDVHLSFTSRTKGHKVSQLTAGEVRSCYCTIFRNTDYQLEQAGQSILS